MKNINDKKWPKDDTLNDDKTAENTIGPLSENSARKISQTMKIELAMVELGESATRKEIRKSIPESEINNQTFGRLYNRIIARKKKSSCQDKSNNIAKVNGCVPSGGFGGDRVVRSSCVVPEVLWKECRSRFGEIWGPLYCYLLSYFHGFDHSVLLPQRVLASLAPINAAKLKLGRKIVLGEASSILELLTDRSHARPFEIYVEGTYSFRTGESRTVQWFEELPELEELLSSPGKAVDCFTGLPACRDHSAKPSETIEVERLRMALNDQEIDYGRFVRREVMEAIRTIGCFRTRVFQRNIWASIVSEPQPVYTAVGRSSRLYASGASFQTLESSLRDIAFEGCLRLDLKAAQLAIYRKLWDVPEIDRYLDQGVWRTLMGETGILDKKPLKHTLYRLIFGGRLSQAERELRSEYGLSHAESNAVYGCELFQVLSESQKAIAEKVELDGGVVDAFGRFHSLEPEHAGQSKAQRRRSILSTQAQSYEMRLILPAVNHLMDRGFPILVFLHDGFITTPDAWEEAQKAKDLVDSLAVDLGIRTNLVVETL